MARTNVFICYSREDDCWRTALREHLEPFAGDDGPLDVWDDTGIEAGELWREKIADALATAKVGVLLISPAFLASEFISDDEIPALLAAAATAGARLLCVYARPSLAHLRPYKYTDPMTGERRTRRLTEFQGLNRPETPLSSLTEHECGVMLTRVATAILAAAEGGGARPRPTADPRPYLEKLRHDTRWLDVRGIGAKAAERVELERVYTRLRVVGPAGAGAGDADEKRHAHTLAGDVRTRDLELRDLLREHPHLVLVGDPGAGKTTFLRFVALNLARALLGEDKDSCLERIGLKRDGHGATEPQRRPSDAMESHGNEGRGAAPRTQAGEPRGGEPPFPVLVRLGSFGQFLSANPSVAFPPESAEHFHLYLDHLCRGFHTGLPERFLREQVLAGGCLLLLDGLDEVPGQDVRERVGAILEEVVAAGQALGNRHVVTCRTRAYQGKARLGADFTRGTLVDFGPGEVDEFVTQWSCALFRVAPGEDGSSAADDAAAHRHELLSAIRAHPHVQPLTANPLLLTILAVVHWNRKKLPEQRADLYEEALNYLLETREKLSAYDTTERKHCLRAIALRLFDEPQGVRKTLGRREAAEVVGQLLGVDLARADAVVEDEELYSGILVSRTEGEVEFWHPTFAEYLAAVELAWQSDWWERIRVHLFDERWSEVVLLLAGCLRRQGSRLASDFIRNILGLDASLAERARQVGLIGRILRDIRVRATGADPAQGTGYAEARQQVLEIFERGSTVAEGVRIEVGEALGQAGDPRISDDDHANRVFIPGGTFWMGAQERGPKKPGYDPDCFDFEAPVHRVTLSDFWIDRYPVTVQQYRRFVEADAEGYLKQRFWRREGWSWREKKARTQPAAWEEQLQYPNRPVTYVSWHEAAAYCAWLAKRTGHAVRLPTEAQWEYAARGTQGRKYPWGDAAPTDQHANFNYRVGRPTPVGIYPLGATPEGVQDLAGNVEEWCLDWWADKYAVGEQIDPSGPTEGSSRLLRGGGFNLDPRYCRAAFRDLGDPEINFISIGFRCVVMGGRTE